MNKQSEKVLFFRDSNQKTFEILELTGWELLAVKAFGGIRSIGKSKYDQLVDIYKNVFYNLLDKKQIYVLEKRYGLLDGKCCTLAEIADMLGLSISQISRIEDLALKKLGRSVYSFRLLYRYGYYHDNMDHNSLIQFEYVLKEELVSYLEGKEKDYLFMNAILKKNKCRFYLSGTHFYQKSLEDIGISYDTAYELASHNIKTAYSLCKCSEEEIKEKINDEEVINEAITKRYSYLRKIDDYVTVIFERKSEKIVYKYKDTDSTSLANEIFKMILDTENCGGSIFSLDTSHGLLNILLLKGYIHVKDILEELPELIKQLESMKLFEYSDELQLCMRVYQEKIDDMRQPRIFIKKYNKKLMSIIEKNNLRSINELYSIIDQLDSFGEQLSEFIFFDTFEKEQKDDEWETIKDLDRYADIDFEEKDLSYYIERLLRRQEINSVNDIKEDIMQQLKPLSRKVMERVAIRLGYSDSE